MKFSAKCRTKKLGVVYSFWEVFAQFLIRKGPIIGPKSDPGKSLSLNLQKVHASLWFWVLCCDTSLHVHVVLRVLSSFATI